MESETVKFSISQIDSIIKKLELLKDDVQQLESHKNYVENKLMVEMKKNSIISLITLI
jgi:predicted phage-related endonuclease